MWWGHGGRLRNRRKLGRVACFLIRSLHVSKTTFGTLVEDVAEELLRHWVGTSVEECGLGGSRNMIRGRVGNRHGQAAWGGSWGIDGMVEGGGGSRGMVTVLRGLRVLKVFDVLRVLRALMVLRILKVLRVVKILKVMSVLKALKVLKALRVSVS